MRNSLRRHRETGAAGSFAEKYANDGSIRRLPSAKRNETPASHYLRTFFIEEAKLIREATEDTTASVEFTLRTKHSRHFNRFRKDLQAGTVFAMEPKNDSELVNSILDALGMDEKTALQKRPVNVHSSYLLSNTMQRLTPREIVTSLKDLSRPTPQLVNLLLERSGREHEFDAKGVEQITECYDVPQLLKHFRDVGGKPLISFDEFIVNQPNLRNRPYTISDFDRETGQFKILVSDVTVKLNEADPLQLKDGMSSEAHIKRGGAATRMLLDLAGYQENGNTKAGTTLEPAKEFPINGVMDTSMPRLLFPGVNVTRSMKQWMKAQPENARAKSCHEFITREFDGETSVFMMGTGSGIAPYMAHLREQARNPVTDRPKQILMNTGRHAQDEILKEEIEGYIKDNILDDYYYGCTRDKKIFHSFRDEEGNIKQEIITPEGKSCYLQDILQQQYGEELIDNLQAGKALIYVCGNELAQNGLEKNLGTALLKRQTENGQVLTKEYLEGQLGEESLATLKKDGAEPTQEMLQDAFSATLVKQQEQDGSMQGTASLPSRHYTAYWRDYEARDDEGKGEEAHHLEPDFPEMPRWRKIVRLEGRHSSNWATHVMRRDNVQEKALASANQRPR